MRELGHWSLLAHARQTPNRTGPITTIKVTPPRGIMIIFLFICELVYGPKVRLDQVTLSGPDLQIELVTVSLAFAFENCTSHQPEVVA